MSYSLPVRCLLSVSASVVGFERNNKNCQVRVTKLSATGKVISNLQTYSPKSTKQYMHVRAGIHVSTEWSIRTPCRRSAYKLMRGWEANRDNELRMRPMSRITSREGIESGCSISVRNSFLPSLFSADTEFTERVKNQCCMKEARPYSSSLRLYFPVWNIWAIHVEIQMFAP